MQDEAHLVGVGRSARRAIAGELRFVTVDQVLGLAACAVERVVDMLGRALGQRGNDITDVRKREFRRTYAGV